MHFTISKEQLITPLQLVSGAVEKRQTLPVLGNVLLRVEQGKLTLTATDLEIEMTSVIALDGEYQDGDITVPARKFLDICRSLSDEHSIQVSLEEGRLKINAGRSRFSLSTIAATEFPNIEDAVFPTQFSIPCDVLSKLIEKTQFAMANQDVRYYLNGMLLEVNGDKLVAVATDGHRLALARHQLEESAADDLIQAIIPRKGVLEAAKILNTEAVEVAVGLSSNHIRLQVGDFTFISKLIDGRFPDYEKVLPRDAKRILVGQREKLKEAFSRAAILCNEKFRGVRLELEKGKLLIHANNPEQEEAHIEVDVDYDDQTMEIGFNVGYLLDALNALKTDSVRFNLGDANSSVLIESNDSDDCLYVVMPMRL
jgi:DNA polymerase-3 subunit beta